MAGQMYTVRSASDAWKLLRGLVCVHKPADGTVPSLLHNLRKRLACDLNDMRRSVEYNSLQIEEKSSKDDDGTKTNHSSDLEKYEGGYEGLVSQNYATHPLVLGKGNYCLSVRLCQTQIGIFNRPCLETLNNLCN